MHKRVSEVILPVGGTPFGKYLFDDEIVQRAQTVNRDPVQTGDPLERWTSHQLKHIIGYYFYI